MLMCVQAKLGFVPFDIPEAETEIISGPCIEYSGKVMAMFRLTKAVLFFALPAFLLALYFCGFRLSLPGAFISLSEYVLILVLLIVIKNTNPRVRIDQAMRFFWTIMTAVAAAGVLLAFTGN